MLEPLQENPPEKTKPVPSLVQSTTRNLPEIASQTPNLLDSKDVMAYMPRADFFLWFTPTASRLAIITAIAPFFLFILGQIGILQSLIFPLTIAYINSLKPFLQMGISQDMAPLLTGFQSTVILLINCGAGAIAFLTWRILSGANALCLTKKGLSFGTSSGAAKNQVIYQEKEQLDFSTVTEIEIIRPKATRSNLDYQFIFRRGAKEAVKIRYGDILKANDRATFVAAVKDAFSDRIDDEMLEPFELAPEKQSYTALWLKELSAPPKRNKLTPLELGAQLHNGRYSIISKIGMGGQGTVYLAQDNQAKNESEREIVLKEFLLPVFPDTRVRKAAAIKFQEEADLLGKLSHPQIVKFYELFLEDHRAYLVLEKLDGVTLKDYVDQQGAFPAKTVEELTAQMCTILQYLHNQTPPVVHRDFTPDNLILGEDGQIKLLDFSVAQSVTSNVTGSVVGKPHYIAPEQFRGKATWQSDIYSLGATLFFMSTGKQPEPITNLKLRPDEASPKLAKIIEKATKLDTANRYKKAEEILEDLA